MANICDQIYPYGKPCGPAGQGGGAPAVTPVAPPPVVVAPPPVVVVPPPVVVAPPPVFVQPPDGQQNPPGGQPPGGQPPDGQQNPPGGDDTCPPCNSNLPRGPNCPPCGPPVQTFTAMPNPLNTFTPPGNVGQGGNAAPVGNGVQPPNSANMQVFIAAQPAAARSLAAQANLARMSGIPGGLQGTNAVQGRRRY
jgi:hypothetical protein